MKQLSYLQYWLLLSVAVTGVCGLAYLLAQQSLRQSANEPQIQIAKDAVRILESGKTPADFATANIVNIKESSAPFLVIYNSAYKPIASTGQLNGTAPILPEGVLQYANERGENLITWQPESNARFALVVLPYSDGFVAVGRSLKETENRINDFLLITGIVWLATLLATLVLTFLKDSWRNFKVRP
ncbi:MAG: hypothetical protein Q7S01_04750 [bacterium]|nr:hypothetical protein [bacterium]